MLKVENQEYWGFSPQRLALKDEDLDIWALGLQLLAPKVTDRNLNVLSFNFWCQKLEINS
jgi:hypothetical protein